MNQYLNLIHFPIACEFRNAALGQRRKIRVGALKGFISLPRANPEVIGEPFSELLRPRTRDVDFAVRVFDHSTSNVWERLNWGGYFTYNVNNPEGTAIASVRFAAVTFAARQNGKLLSLSEVAKECLEHMPAWCSRLATWIEVITKDDLNAEHSLHAAADSERWTTTAWITSSRRKPKYDYVNPNLTLFGSNGKLAMNSDQWRAAIRGANRNVYPPEVHLLLRDARGSAIRNNGRRAILDLATAVELVIEPALRAHLGKTMTSKQVNAVLTKEWQFSKRQALMKKNKMWLPPDLQTKVMTLRNNAAHKNAVVTRAQATDAIAVVEQLVSRYSPLKLP